MVREAAGRARGILHSGADPAAFRHFRLLPSRDLAFFLEHHWSVQWDLRDRPPHLAETLPHPTVHMIFGPGRPSFVGLSRSKFSQMLAGRGWVFGVKFKPGAFHPFLKSPVSALADAARTAEDVFGAEGAALEQGILGTENEDRWIEMAEAFLRSRKPSRDPRVEELGQIAERIINDRSITQVEQVAEFSGLERRTLQRLFERYVGVSPKWVIRRYRLHEALERLDRREIVDFTELALDLGYFDQAHFITDFKSVTGFTPAAYAARVSAAPGEPPSRPGETA